VRLHLEKILAAPPARVFGAFTDPGQLREWFGPVGFTVRGVRYDAAEGTDYRLVMQPPEGDVFHIRGTFRTVDAPRRLAFTFVYEEPDPDDEETVVTVTFEAHDAGTRVALEQEPFRTPARLELHRQGWTETLERLQESLARG